VDKAVNRKMNQVRVRWSVNRLLVESTRVLSGIGWLCTALILFERLFAVPFWSILSLEWIAAGAVVIILYRWVPLIPTRLQISLYIDNHLHLRERFSCLIAFEGDDSPFGRAACNEATRYLEGVEPARQFPVRLSRSWLIAGGLWFLVGFLHYYLPTFDVLGRHAQQQQQLAQEQQWKTVENTIRETSAVVKQIAERLHHPELDAALADMNQPPTAPTLELAHRQAIRRLGDLADRIKQSESQPTNRSQGLLQQALKQLRPTAGELSRQLQLALARGQFQQAGLFLRDLEKQLHRGALPLQQQESLARQLGDLAQQIQKMSEQALGLEEAMETQGLERRLAQLDPSQLQTVLRQKGLSETQIEEWMQQQAAMRLAQDCLGGLAQALAGTGNGGELSAEGLAAALSQVDELAARQQERLLSDAALAAIDRAIGTLGQSMDGEGEGLKTPFRPGLAQSFSPGSGGPGHGKGNVDSDTAGDFDTKKTRIENAGSGGPTIASWYFQGAQSAGQAQRSWQEVLQASREQAAEAIEENRIPGKYHDSVKRYFGELEDVGDQP
jgi:hypothetical protein